MSSYNRLCVCVKHDIFVVFVTHKKALMLIQKLFKLQCCNSCSICNAEAMNLLHTSSMRLSRDQTYELAH